MIGLGSDKKIVKGDTGREIFYGAVWKMNVVANKQLNNSFLSTKTRRWRKS